MFSLPDIIRVKKTRRMSWAEHVACMGVRRGVFKVMVWKTDGKRPLGRAIRRWEGNIKMDLQEIGWGWIGSIWLKIGTGGGILCMR